MTLLRMASVLVAGLLTVIAATATSAVTLTVTPERSVYSVGEEITLSVFGDPQGASGFSAFGRLQYDPSLARFVGASQSPLTSFAVPWTLCVLENGPGFVDAFCQIRGVSPQPVDNALASTLVLQATNTGMLTLAWLEDMSPFSLEFFGIADPQGATLTIVPQPSTGALLSLGLAITAALPTGRHRRPASERVRSRSLRDRPLASGRRRGP